MDKQVVVMKVFPKVNGDYLKEFDVTGFKITESKKSAVYFKKDKTKTYSNIREQMKEFEQFINKFNLPHSFEVEKTITYTEKKPNLSKRQVYSEIVESEKNN